MSKTVTFRDVEKLWEITVKKEFLKKCKTPTKHSVMKLFTEYNVEQFLHNPCGPAMRCLSSGKERVKMYFIDGCLLPPYTKEGQAKIKEIQKLEK